MTSLPVDYVVGKYCEPTLITNRQCLIDIDYINRQKLWLVLKNTAFAEHLIRAIQSCYQDKSFKMATGNKFEHIDRGER